MERDSQAKEGVVEASYQEKNPRLFSETGLEAKILAVILPIVEDLGYQIVRVKLLQQNGLTLQIMAEKEDHSMNVEDCEKLSNVLSPILDLEDIIPQNYHLEISSPGIDRPLVRVADFCYWQGHLAKIETISPFYGKKRFRGHLVEANQTHFTLKLEKPLSDGEVTNLSFPYEEIITARLILTDSLIREALAKDKALRNKKLKKTQ